MELAICLALKKQLETFVNLSHVHCTVQPIITSQAYNIYHSPDIDIYEGQHGPCCAPTDTQGDQNYH